MQDETRDNSKKKEFTGGDEFFNQMKDAGVADEAFIKEIVGMFLEEGKESLQKLDAAIAADDLTKTRLLAHKLKSSFLMFDMVEAHELAAQLESKKETGAESIKTLSDRLNEVCTTQFALLRKKYL